MGDSIQALPLRYDVAQAVKELDRPDVWNRYRHRLDRYGSPHTDVSDVWCRFNAIEHLDDDPLAFFNGPHESVWYPVMEHLPAVKALAYRLFADVEGSRLGGVLITKIPPGGEVKPHVDGGWHASYYEKFAVQLLGNERQAFCFDDAKLSALPGEVYTFDNSRMHWVTNDSDSDRMTLIVCIRR